MVAYEQVWYEISTCIFAQVVQCGWGRVWSEDDIPMFSTFFAEQKPVQSRQLGIYGSQPEARRNIRKLPRLIRVHDGIQNGRILVSGRDTTWLEELVYELFLLWWRRWKSQIKNLFHGRFIRVAKSPARCAVPRRIIPYLDGCRKAIFYAVVNIGWQIEHTYAHTCTQYLYTYIHICTRTRTHTHTVICPDSEMHCFMSQSILHILCNMTLEMNATFCSCLDVLHNQCYNNAY